MLNQGILQSIVQKRKNLILQLNVTNNKKLILRQIKALDNHAKRYLLAKAGSAKARPVQKIDEVPVFQRYFEVKQEYHSENPENTESESICDSKTTVEWGEFIKKRKLEYKNQLRQAKIIKQLENSDLFASYIKTRNNQYFRKIEF